MRQVLKDGLTTKGQREEKLSDKASVAALFLKGHGLENHLLVVNRVCHIYKKKFYSKALTAYSLHEIIQNV